MVSQKTIKGLDFEAIDEYYQYVIDSITNGQIKQAQELYNKFSNFQKFAFLTWYDATYHYEGCDNNTDHIKELSKTLTL